MSRIEQLISEIEEYIDGCKPQAFTNSKKIIVDKDEMEELLVELRLRTPDEIKKYQKIISNKEAIISSAQEEADGILGRARAEAEKLLSDAKETAEQTLSEAEKSKEEMLSDHEIIQQAYQQASDLMEQTNAQAQQLAEQASAQAQQMVEQASAQAQQLVNDAVSDSDNIREGAIRYTDNMLKSLQSIISYTIEHTEGKYVTMLETLRSSYETVSGNRSELQVPTAQGVQEPQTTEPEVRKEKSSGGLNADMLG